MVEKCKRIEERNDVHEPKENMELKHVHNFIKLIEDEGECCKSS